LYFLQVNNTLTYLFIGLVYKKGQEMRGRNIRHRKDIRLSRAEFELKDLYLILIKLKHQDEKRTDYHMICFLTTKWLYNKRHLLQKACNNYVYFIFKLNLQQRTFAAIDFRKMNWILIYVFQIH
jgi:hypothetical protein